MDATFMRIALRGRYSDWKNIIRITKVISRTAPTTTGKRENTLSTALSLLPSMSTRRLSALRWGPAGYWAGVSCRYWSGVRPWSLEIVYRDCTSSTLESAAAVWLRRARASRNSGVHTPLGVVLTTTWIGVNRLAPKAVSSFLTPTTDSKLLGSRRESAPVVARL